MQRDGEPGASAGTGQGRREPGALVAWPTALRHLLVNEKSPVLQRPPDSPQPLQNSTASDGLVGTPWCTFMWP